MAHNDTRQFTFSGAQDAIKAGQASAHALWMLLSDEKERDEFGLKPAVWDGAGEYQRVVYSNGADVLVRVPFGESLLGAA